MGGKLGLGPWEQEPRAEAHLAEEGVAADPSSWLIRLSRVQEGIHYFFPPILST